jgi:hypothetical protein
MKKVVRLTESELHNLIKNCLFESQYMSDEDIANQYSDMEIINFKLNPLKHSEGWEGTFELQFPNADDIDYDSSMVNNFIVYDKEGEKIAWDNWMPQGQTDKLEAIIRDEIRKRLSNNILNEAVSRAIRKYLK